MKNQKIIFITGTHHTPAIELITELRNDPAADWKIYYLAHIYPTESHIAHTIIPKLKVEFINLDCGKFNRKDLLKTLAGIPDTVIAVIKSYRLMLSHHPNIIVSFGGYVSVPVIFAAWLRRIPSITHEQTLTNSLATRINAFFTNKVALSFDNPVQLKQLPAAKTVITGNLIRRAVFNQKSPKFSRLKLNLTKQPLLYITGGNQGSQFLNRLAYGLVPLLAGEFTIVHQTGKNNLPATESRLKSRFPSYLPLEFIEMEDIGWVLNHSRLILSRAGANICQEISALKRSSVLIPLPFAQQQEQLLNANWLKNKLPKNTIIIRQESANVAAVSRAVNELISQPDLSAAAPKIINSRFLDLLHEVAV